jgi:hypothetical protein
MRASHHPVGARLSSKSADKIKRLGLINPISPHLYDVSLYRNLFRSWDRIRLTG